MFGFGKSKVEKEGLDNADYLRDTIPAGKIYHRELRNYAMNLSRSNHVIEMSKDLTAGGLAPGQIFATAAVVAWMPIKFNYSLKDDYRDLKWVAMMTARTSAKRYLSDADRAYDEAYQMETWFTVDGEVVLSAPYKKLFEPYCEGNDRYMHIIDIFGTNEHMKYHDECGARLSGVDEQEAENAWDVGVAKGEKIWRDNLE
tara:strand:- start:8724 stop:9323 length:600 start_codon:yes stop_codon:yes gene_type:complete